VEASRREEREPSSAAAGNSHRIHFQESTGFGFQPKDSTKPAMAPAHTENAAAGAEASELRRAAAEPRPQRAKSTTPTTAAGHEHGLKHFGGVHGSVGLGPRADPGPWAVRPGAP
jgi:hypothetical protein